MDSKNPDVTVVRMDSPAQGKAPMSLLQHMFVEWGTKEDWDALCELHYKGHSLAAGSRFLRCMLRIPGDDPQLVGIMVMANPQTLGAGRNEVFPRLRPNVGGRDNRMINQMRLRWINENIIWNNRTVLDTMFRSVGIAYRLKNIGYRMFCAHYGRAVVESMSSMGRFNPFSEKTGMKFIKPRTATALEAGLQFFEQHFAAPAHDIVAIQQELDSKDATERDFLERRLREFYYKWSSMEKSGDKRDLGMTRVNSLPMQYVLKQIMQLIFSATVYWVWFMPDKGAKLPEAMPLLAFDEQGPNEPLARDWSTYDSGFPVLPPPLTVKQKEEQKDKKKNDSKTQA